MQVVQRLLRLLRRKPRGGAPGAAASALLPRVAPEDADAAALIATLRDQAMADAVEVDAAQIDRVAAKVVRKGYTVVPEVAAFPVSAQRIIQVGERDDGDLNPLIRAITQDAAVTASLLGLANSAASMPSAPITTVRDAVLRLGAHESRHAAIAVAMRGMYRAHVGSGDAMSALRTEFFASSLADAFTADWLAGVLHFPGAERAFVLTMVRELARPAALAILVGELASDAARLGPPEILAVVDAAAPMVARALGEALKLPPGLEEALLPSEGRDPPVVHVARLVASLGGLLRSAPLPPRWAAQAERSAIALDMRAPMVRAAITHRTEDERIAQRIAGGA